MKIPILFTLFLGFIVSIQSQAQVASAASPWQVYDKEGLHIEYPSEWEFKDGGTTGTKFLIMSPLDGEADNFQENVNLISQDISAYNLDLDGYAELTKSQIGTMLKDGKVLEYKKQNAGEKDFIEIVYTADFEGTPLKWKQYVWVEGANAYVLTFTAKLETYDNYIGDGTQILDSFKF